MPTAHPDPVALQALLNPAPRRHWRRLALALVGLGLSAAGAWWAWRAQPGQGPQYQTATLSRGALTVSVAATGSLQPTTRVAVGSELSGTVAAVHAETNQQVRRGQLLVELDPTRIREQVAAARANLAGSRAALRLAEASQEEARRQLERLQGLRQSSQGQLPAQQELDAAQAAAARSAAQRDAAAAQVLQAQAALRADESNLRKTSIRAPIAGVVLARSVEPGNAVAASLQAVTLFTLAEDLRSLRLDVNIDEADVGQVRAGQAASFTVSAYPERRYPARIARVGLGPTTKDNVVTYLAELQVDNGDLSLRPGMTANAQITTAERADVLLLPNAALRFQPAAAAASSAGQDLLARLMPRPPRSGARRSAGTDTRQVRQIWVLQDGRPLALAVRPGLSDGRMTEVQGEQLRPGMAVIVGQGRQP